MKKSGLGYARLNVRIYRVVYTYRVGDKGELLVKSEEMCSQGYHNNASQSAKSFADGW